MVGPSSSFWEFSLTVYSKSGVPDACLELQDKHGADVNIVLFMLWVAVQGRRLNAEDIGGIVSLTADWQKDVVRPLRLARRFLKAPAAEWQLQETAALRARIKADELEAERVQHSVMANFFHGHSIGQADEFDTAAFANLEAYAMSLRVVFPAQIVLLLTKAARHEM
ncbi:TIGR02444 family protein [Bradyrhizobium sp. SYSU BS000235]|uniref:TIGR02444 family protein n=1 Tax=Bradyrhizobium sp. SYSU BS000235 TaxID=3411332 RepID=UPI003C71A8CD